MSQAGHPSHGVSLMSQLRLY